MVIGWYPLVALMSTMLVTVELRLMDIFFCSVDGLDSLNVDTRYRLDGLLSKVFLTFFNFFLEKEEGF